MGDWSASGSQGTDDGQFSEPAGVAVDPFANVYVADTRNYRIQKFDSNGNFIIKWVLASDYEDYNYPNGVATDPSGNVYVLMSQSGPPFMLFPPEKPRVEKFGSNGDFITRWGSRGVGDGEFAYPNSLAVDLSGNVYVADTYNHRIQKFSLILPTITLQSPSINELFNTCSLYSPPTFSWNASEPFSNYKIQFSPGWGFASVLFELTVQPAATQITIPLATWKEVMMIPGLGGTVYWRVIGTKADEITETSGVRNFVTRVESAGDLKISPTSKRSKPTLTWEKNCNTKFKMVFGSDSSFMKRTYSIEIGNPDGSEGTFSKTLTFQQWLRIKMLVRNKTGSSIYWYVESWDGLNRYAKTEVMNFTLMD